MLTQRVRSSLVRPLDLDRQHALLRAVVERANGSAILEKDLAGNVLAFSARASELYGYTPEEIMGKSALLLHAPAEVESGRARAIIEQAVCAGKWDGRTYQIRKNGSGFWAQLTLLLRRDSNGKPRGLVSISRDLTELERLDLELTRSRALGATMLESRVHLLAMTNSAGLISDVNALFCEVVGEPREELIGTPLARFCSEPGAAEAAVLGALSSQEAESFELSLQVRGKLFACDGTAFVVPAAGRGEDGVFLTLRAQPAGSVSRPPPELEAHPQSVISTRGAAPTEPIHAATRSLACAHLSHELRTPLSAVLGFAELLHGGQAGPLTLVQREYLEDILHSARHMLNLLNSELDAAKLNARQVKAHDRVELGVVLTEVRRALRIGAGEKRITVAIQQGCELSLAAETATKVRQIAFNYLSNALKFTPEGGRVTLSCHLVDAETLCVQVRDTGMGVRHESQGRLFHDFEQLDIPGELRDEGSGLGLAITRRIAEALGGEVALDSTPGIGSVFSVSLPLSELDAHVLDGLPESATRLVAASRRHSETSLNLEDDRTLCA